MSVVKVTQEDDARFVELVREYPSLGAHEYALKRALSRHRQSAIAELCEGLATALDIIETLAESSADVSNTAAIIENGAGADGVIREAMDARDRLTALLSKHSPDAPGNAGTRATESGDGDEA